MAFLKQEEHWRKFLRGNLIEKQFPREMFVSRVTIRSEEIYLKQLRHNFISTDCFISEYTRTQLEQGVVDCIFMEVDGSDIEDGKLRASAVQKSLWDLGYEYRYFFSGSRGFHFHIAFPPVQLKYPKRALMQFLRRFPVELMDSHVLGNLAQLVRVPVTKNQKSGLFVVELPSSMDAKKISTSQLFSMAISPKSGFGPYPVVSNDGISDELFEVDKDVRAKPLMAVVTNHKVLGDVFPPCIISSLETLRRTGGLSHPQRLNLGAFLVWSGYSDPEINEVFRLHAKDYVERKSVGQIRKIRQGKLQCYSCGSFRRRGFCPVEKTAECAFFPRILGGSGYG